MKIPYFKQMLFFLLMSFIVSNVRAQSGNALDFDGVDDYVSVPNSESLNPTNALTIEAWVYTNSSSNQIIAHKWVGGGQYSMEIASGKLQFVVHTGISYWSAGSATDLPLNTWVHCTAVYDGSSITIYENGIQKGYYFNGATSLAIASGDLTIGRRSESAAGYFSGMMDEIRIWNVARSQTDLQNNLNSSITSSDAQWSNLVAYYQFNQGTANGDNSGVSQLTDNSSSGINTDTLNSFALTGTTSNWVATPIKVTTNSYLPITESSIQMNGSIIGTGGNPITKRGFCYSSTNTNPTITDSKIDETGDFPTGSYSLTATGLTPGATYYFCSYATNSLGTTIYGSVKSINLTFPMGNALDFDGTDDYVSVPNSSSLNPTGVQVL